MKKFLTKKFIQLICVLSVILFSASHVYAAEQLPVPPVETRSESTVGTRAYEYEWRYKVINDHLYKRKYNMTTGKWVGNWIKV